MAQVKFFEVHNIIYQVYLNTTPFYSRHVQCIKETHLKFKADNLKQMSQPELKIENLHPFQCLKNAASCLIRFSAYESVKPSLFPEI